MSSSKVIKSANNSIKISEFDFQNVLRNGSLPSAQNNQSSEDFIPMELFDPSELGDKIKFTPRPKIQEEPPPPPPPPPGKFITDEDLQRYQEESYQRGLQDGKNLAERGLLNVFKGLRTAAEDLQLLREKVLRDSEDDLLSLTLAISRKILQREVIQDRMIVKNLIETALSNLNSQDNLVIRVHPDDHSLLVTNQNDALKSELAAVKFTLKADPAVELGSCRIETERGTVDAGFEAQLDEIYRRLLEEKTETEHTAGELE